MRVTTGGIDSIIEPEESPRLVNRRYRLTFQRMRSENPGEVVYQADYLNSYGIKETIHLVFDRSWRGKSKQDTFLRRAEGADLLGGYFTDVQVKSLMNWGGVEKEAPLRVVLTGKLYR